MPTDWPIFALNIVCKIKSKFKGNIRYVEVDAFNKKSLVTTGIDHTLAPSVTSNDEYMESVEDENNKNIKRLDSELINEIISVSETEETADTVHII